jgi:hypothetical protein
MVHDVYDYDGTVTHATIVDVDHGLTRICYVYTKILRQRKRS